MDRHQPHKVIFHGARELISLVRRGAGKLKDKYIWTKEEVEEARGYLIYFRDTMKEENGQLFRTFFGESGDFFDLTPFARGYSARVLSFKTNISGQVKQWVLKVGFEYALIAYNGDPSEMGYTKEYQEYLDTLRKAVKKYEHLSRLLPEPQVITFASLPSIDKEKKKGTTLAIQPLMHVVRPNALKKTITIEQKKELLTELREFQNMSNYLVQHHEVGPELVGEGNLEIVQFGENEYHLMLLDMGWVDMKKILPITQTVNYFSTKFVINKLETWLKSKVGQ